MSDVRNEVFELIASTLDVRKSDITLDAKWEDQQADSFALVELLVGVQEKFRIRFDPRELRNLKSVGDMVRVVERKVAKR